MLKIVSASVLLLCGCAMTAEPAALGQAPAASKGSASAEQITKEFYARYAALVRREDEWRRTPRAERQRKELKMAYVQILEEHPEYLHPVLRQALIEDYTAQQATPGVIVGIDWDPFFCNQEELQPYSTLGEREAGTRHTVEVLVGAPDSKWKEVVEVELSVLNGHEVITDIRCGLDKLGLLDHLRLLKEDRR